MVKDHSERKQQRTGKGEEKEVKLDLTLGLGGIFRGLGTLLDLASELAQKAEQFQTEVKTKEPAGPVGGPRGLHGIKTETRAGSVGGPRGLHAVYGFSIRLGGEGRPIIESFGNIREKEGKGPVVDETREPITDLLDEGDHFLVVAELPGTEERDVRWQLKDDILIISSESGDRKYYKELLLPAAVEEKRIESSCKNGVLQLKLWKAKSA